MMMKRGLGMRGGRSLRGTRYRKRRFILRGFSRRLVMLVVVTKEAQINWININMAIEKDGLVDGLLVCDDTLANFPVTKDSRVSFYHRLNEPVKDLRIHMNIGQMSSFQIGPMGKVSFFNGRINHPSINSSIM